MRKLAIVIGLVACAAPASAINLTINASNASAGGTVEFAVNIYGIQAGGAPVNNAQLDILFDTNVFYAPADARRSCQIAPRLAQLAHTETLPISPPAPAGMQRLRLNVIDTIQPLGDITDGDLYFCSLDVREDAPSGTTNLAGSRQNVGDTAGHVLPTAVGAASVSISGSGNADSLQPRGGAVGGAAGAPVLDIPAQGGGSRGDAGEAAETVRSGGRNGIGSVAQQAPTAAAAQRDAQATPANEAGRDAQAQDRRLGNSAPAAGSLGEGNTANEALATPAGTVSPRATEATTPKVTSTKAVTPTAKKVESAKKAEAPAAEESSGSCALGAPSNPSGGWLVMIAGLAVGLRRRRSLR